MDMDRVHGWGLNSVGFDISVLIMLSGIVGHCVGVPGIPDGHDMQFENEH